MSSASSTKWHSPDHFQEVTIADRHLIFLEIYLVAYHASERPSACCASPTGKTHKPHWLPAMQQGKTAALLNWLVFASSDLTVRINTSNIKRSPGISLSRPYIITKNRCYGKSLRFKHRSFGPNSRGCYNWQCAHLLSSIAGHIQPIGDSKNVCFTNEFHASCAKSASLFGHIRVNCTLSWSRHKILQLSRAVE